MIFLSTRSKFKILTNLNSILLKLIICWLVEINLKLYEWNSKIEIYFVCISVNNESEIEISLIIYDIFKYI